MEMTRSVVVKSKWFVIFLQIKKAAVIILMIPVLQRLVNLNYHTRIILAQPEAVLNYYLPLSVTLGLFLSDFANFTLH